MKYTNNILEASLTMLGAQEHIKTFKKFGIDSSVLSVLTDSDLQILGVQDPRLRKKMIKQFAKLSISEKETDLTVDKNYLTSVIQDIDNHLLLLDASLSYAVRNEDLKPSDIKLLKATGCLIKCAQFFDEQLHGLQDMITPKPKKKDRKWKYAILFIMTSAASLYMFKKLLKG